MDMVPGVHLEDVKISQVLDHALFPTYLGGFIKGFMAAMGDDVCPNYQDFMLNEDVAPFVTALTVLDLREPKVARYRFCGSGVFDRTGVDLTDHNLLDLLPEEGREELYADMLAMMANPCGNFSRHVDTFASGNGVTSESLSLPLKHRKNASAALLVTLHTSEWTFLPEAQRNDPLEAGEIQIGSDWLQSVFVDIGNGTPGQTTFQKNQSTRKP